MSERVGFTGWLDNKTKVFFEGSFYYAVINGKNYVIDFENMPESRKTRI